MATNPLQDRHLKTVLLVRIAAMIRGGLNDACESQVTVAAP